MTRRSLLRAGSSVLGVGIVVFIASRSDWRAAGALLAGVQLPWLCAVFAVDAFLRVFRGLLWHFYQRSAGYPVSRRKSLTVLLAGDFAGTFFVGSLGSLSRPFLMRLADGGAPLEENTVAVVFEQYVTLVSHTLVLLLGGAILLVIQPRLTVVHMAPAFATGFVYAVVVVIAAAIVVRGEFRPRSAARLIALVPGAFSRRLSRPLELLVRFRERLARLLFKRSVLLPGLGAQLALNTVLVAAHTFCLLRALGITLPFLLLLVVPTTYLTLANIPVSPGGVGLVEGYGFLLLTRLGLSGEAALSCLLLGRVAGLLVTLVSGAAALALLGGRSAIGTTAPTEGS